MPHVTREAWLQEACGLLESTLLQADLGLADVRVSCGWPSRGAMSRAKRRIGECWHGQTNKDGHAHVFVSPCLESPVEVIATLLHELIHATLPAKVKHSRTFANAAKRCGLDGKPTATVSGETLTARINAEMLPVLGPYPHSAIDASLGRKKQTTRLRKWTCPCGRIARVASDDWHATCNDCEGRYVQDIPDTEGE